MSYGRARSPIPPKPTATRWRSGRSMRSFIGMSGSISACCRSPTDSPWRANASGPSVEPGVAHPVTRLDAEPGDGAAIELEDGAHRDLREDRGFGKRDRPLVNIGDAPRLG